MQFGEKNTWQNRKIEEKHQLREDYLFQNEILWGQYLFPKPFITIALTYALPGAHLASLVDRNTHQQKEGDKQE
jgi:hypothetical protein